MKGSSSTELPYKFNGKELDSETGLCYYGARYMNPITSLWYGVDPLAEKYVSTGANVYCVGNPVILVDPDGKKWDDPKDAEKLKKNITNKIKSIEEHIEKTLGKINEGYLSEEKLKELKNKIDEFKQRIGNLNQSINDIDLLGADNINTYVLVSISNGEHHVRKGDDGKVYIETSSDALSIHEITHVRQSLNRGGLVFKNGLLLNAGLQNANIKDSKRRLEERCNMEVNAYIMQYSYDTSFSGRTDGINGININSVGNIKKDDGSYGYEFIHSYIVDLNSYKKHKK